MGNYELYGPDGRGSAKLVSIGTAVACSAIATPCLLAALLATGLGKATAIAATTLLILIAAFCARGSLPRGMASSRDRWLFAVFMLLTGAATYRLGHLSVYMLDAENKDFVLNPSGRQLTDEKDHKPFAIRDKFYITHNCFTGSIVAAHLATEGFENIYSRKRYRNAESPTQIHATIGDVLTVDQYQYPPPYLVLPKALMALGHDFFQIRTFWFALNVLVFSLTAILYASWLGGPMFNAYWLSLPLVLIATTTLTAIEIGNAHFLIITVSLLGMLLLEQRRFMLGGALLGYCVAGKIFPGVLLACLLFARRWKAVAATVIAMLTYVTITLLLFGMTPFTAFIEHQVPKLASGEAFTFAFETIRPLMSNLSVMGIPYRLEKLSLIGNLDPAAVAKTIASVYTLVLIVVVAIVGLRMTRIVGTDNDDRSCWQNRRYLAIVWFALLALGQMRNPFLPWGYGNVINLWLISLLLAMTHGSITRSVLSLVMWGACFFVLPLPFGPPTVMFDIAYGLVVTVLIVGLCFVLALRTIPKHAISE